MSPSDVQHFTRATKRPSLASCQIQTTLAPGLCSMGILIPIVRVEAIVDKSRDILSVSGEHSRPRNSARRNLSLHPRYRIIASTVDRPLQDQPAPQPSLCVTLCPKYPEVTPARRHTQPDQKRGLPVPSCASNQSRSVGTSRLPSSSSTRNLLMLTKRKENTTHSRWSNLQSRRERFLIQASRHLDHHLQPLQIILSKPKVRIHFLLPHRHRLCPASGRPRWLVVIMTQQGGAIGAAARRNITRYSSIGRWTPIQLVRSPSRSRCH